MNIGCDSKTLLPRRTHLFKVVHISLKYLYTPLFGSKWPDIPDPHCKQSKRSYQLEAPWETPWSEYHVNDGRGSWVKEGQHDTRYTVRFSLSLFFLTEMKCIQIPLTGPKGTEESWGGGARKCQTHSWGLQQKVGGRDINFTKHLQMIFPANPKSDL